MPLFSSLFYGIRKWIKSESDAIGLSIALYTSPLPPLTTLDKLREIGYDYLPSSEQILNGEGLKNLSERMIEMLKVAKHCHKVGNKEPLLRLYERTMSSIETMLELMDYNLSQLYQIMSLFITLIPSIVVSVLFFLEPNSALKALYSTALLGILLCFLGLSIYPWELRIPSPSIKTYIFLSLSIPLFLLINSFKFKHPLLLSFSIASIPSAMISFSNIRSYIKVINEAHELVDKADNCVYNIFYCLNIDNPEYLLDKKWFGIARATMSTLYLLALYGIEEVSESLGKLERIIRNYLQAFKNFRSKTRVMLFYTIVEAFIAAAIYGIIICTLSYFSSFKIYTSLAGENPVYTLIPENLDTISNALDNVLLLNAISLSVATASIREGNPLYFMLYLPLSCFTMWLGYQMAIVYTPVLLS